MAKRLTELYQPGDWVEISFDEETWQPAQVVRLDHPGVWVQTKDGRSWFVTNTRRIKSIPPTNPKP